MMQKNPSHLLPLAFLIMLVITPLLLASCASGGSGKYRTHTHYPPGFSSYYYRPWGGYRPIIIDGRDREIDPDWSVPPPREVTPPDRGVDPDWGVEAPAAPIAEPLPDLGMPDFGGADIDLGGFE